MSIPQKTTYSKGWPLYLPTLKLKNLTKFFDAKLTSGLRVWGQLLLTRDHPDPDPLAWPSRDVDAAGAVVVGGDDDEASPTRHTRAIPPWWKPCRLLWTTHRRWWAHTPRRRRRRPHSYYFRSSSLMLRLSSSWRCEVCRCLPSSWWTPRSWNRSCVAFNLNEIKFSRFVLKPLHVKCQLRREREREREVFFIPNKTKWNILKSVTDHLFKS